MHVSTVISHALKTERLDGGSHALTDNDILKAAEDWRKQGRAVALATVVETWGSAPRPVGANLVIDEEGNFLARSPAVASKARSWPKR